MFHYTLMRVRTLQMMMTSRIIITLARDTETDGSADTVAKRTLIPKPIIINLQTKSATKPNTRQRCAKIGLSLTELFVDTEINANLLTEKSR